MQSTLRISGNLLLGLGLILVGLFSAQGDIGRLIRRMNLPRDWGNREVNHGSGERRSLKGTSFPLLDPSQASFHRVA